MNRQAKPPLRAKLFFIRSDGGDGLQGVMTLPDGTNVIYDIDMGWCELYVKILLDWVMRRLEGFRR